MARGSHWASWEERLAEGAELSTSGCLVWTKAKNSRGYGVIYMDGKVRLAHRVAFFAAHGRWPHAGLVTDHICENKACINPRHLREVSNSANILRAYRHLDPATEPARIRDRANKKRYREKKRGDSNPVV